MRIDQLRAVLPAGIGARIHRTPSGCWVYAGARNAGGYATVKIGGTTHRLHRHVHTLIAGRQPAGDVDHLCHTTACQATGRDCPHRACVRPSHLADVPHRQNLLRGNSPAAMHAKATHCPAGHPYDDVNTQRRADGSRRCRRCNANSQAARRRRALVKG